MTKIKIKFVDFFGDWPYENNFITRALKKYYDIEFSDTPEYLFFSCFGNEHLKYDCVKIFFTGEDISPDFNLCDYAIAFDDMTYGDRYLRFPLFAAIKDVSGVAQTKHLISNEAIEQKTRFCNFVVSNSHANPFREEFFKKLSEYKQVDSGGRFMNNVGGPVEDKLAFQKHYKFSVCFENDSSLGYTSEKIFDGFRAQPIPIYWGNPSIAKDFNPACFINCHDFDSTEEIIEYIIKIDNDDALFTKMLREPIFEDEEIPYRFSKQALEDFLCHIIEQPLEKAKRLSRFSRKQDYLNTHKRYADQDRLFNENIFYKGIKKIIK